MSTIRTDPSADQAVADAQLLMVMAVRALTNNLTNNAAQVICVFMSQAVSGFKT